MKILIINSGSSSVKYQLFDMPQEQVLEKGLVEKIGEKSSLVKDHYQALKGILNSIKGIDAIGHRVVHGAEQFKKPVRIDKKVIAGIRKCCAIAPLHNPANLTGILACGKILPDLEQVAVFDTAFYWSLPQEAYMYGLPYDYYKRLGIRKYGFHGTSHEYVAHEAAKELKRDFNGLKIITCHLGNGCSITAVCDGKAIDTSMGFTPLEGLVMGTRCGDIDPALVTYIMKKKKLGLEKIEGILNKESGLKGISQLSNDMRVLETKAESGDKLAALAIGVFVYRIRKYIGAYIALMGGCDALVFTAGIGEHQVKIRERICLGLFGYLKQEPVVLVIPTNEELMIARQTYGIIKTQN